MPASPPAGKEHTRSHRSVDLPDNRIRLLARADRRLYVTRGLGNSHIPLRLGSRPELAILHIRRVGV